MTARTIARLVRPPVHRHGEGLTTTDIGQRELGAALDPFIMVSLYDMAGPTFPPHPHAGFSVATYILPESPIGFVNQDSIGNRNRIAPGALHLTVAGSGVLHEEQPERTGSVARGYQIWIDHADADRTIEPHAHHLRAADVPTVERDGATIRVVLGGSNGVRSPLAPPTQVDLADVRLRSGAIFAHALASDTNAFLLMLDGSAEIGGRRVEAGDVASMSLGIGGLMVTAMEEGARFTMFAGRPLGQQRFQQGPFVGSHAAQLEGFARDFHAGQFGRLPSFASQPYLEFE